MGTSGERPRLLLGLDVGTQSLRAALVDLQGRTVAFGVAQIETTYPRPTWAEQHPLAWWSAATQAVGLPWPRRTRQPSKSSASASTAQPALLWRRMPTESPSALPCSGWTSVRFARQTRSAVPAIPC